MSNQLSLFGRNAPKKDLDKEKKVVNVASVPFRSPFRYPGGKTWLVPVVRQWLRFYKKVPSLFLEPFLGGGIISLTVAFEHLAEQVLMVELDEEVAAVWEVLVNGDTEWLANKVYNFELNYDNAVRELERENKSIKDQAFCTLLKNRIYHGGIITKGAGMIKKGENGKGLSSRWYPKTLRDRMLGIGHIKNRLSFYRGDAFQYLEQYKDNPDVFVFIDPPYVKAGKRLYTHFNVNHEKLMSITSKLSGKYMLTYDNHPEIIDCAQKFGLKYRLIPMKTTHHIKKHEIIIADSFDWWD